jgi:nucleotide-binding universal stress UspA family protein
MQKKILLVTNGCQESWDTVEYAVWIAALLDLPLTLLGVLEKEDEEHPVEAMFSRALNLFDEKKITYNLQLVNGETEDVLAEMKWDQDTYLVIGPLGRPQFRQWLMGRSFRKIMENVPSPIFYVRSARSALKKVLVCFGGLGYTGKAEEIGILLGKLAGAEITFLHVVPPVESDRLPGNEVEGEILADDASVQVLDEARQHAKVKGVDSQVVVRQGHVVSQIVEEFNAGQYDLICMGSSFSEAESLRHLYAPNVTAEIAEAVNAPILTARSRFSK